MRTSLSSEVISRLQGKTLATAESCTGGGIGAALTAIAGSSEVYKGGIICYTNWVKENVLGVSQESLDVFGAVSSPVAKEMAHGARTRLQADAAVSVTGLAGPGSDDFGHDVGTVFIGYDNGKVSLVEEHHFKGDREEVRRQAVIAALELILRIEA